MVTVANSSAKTVENSRDLRIVGTNEVMEKNIDYLPGDWHFAVLGTLPSDIRCFCGMNHCCPP
jgi:hypothetical protein